MAKFSYPYNDLVICTDGTGWYRLVYLVDQARQTRPNSEGVAEGHPRFDKEWVAIIF